MQPHQQQQQRPPPPVNQPPVNQQRPPLTTISNTMNTNTNSNSNPNYNNPNTNTNNQHHPHPPPASFAGLPPLPMNTMNTANNPNTNTNTNTLSQSMQSMTIQPQSAMRHSTGPSSYPPPSQQSQGMPPAGYPLQQQQSQGYPRPPGNYPTGQQSLQQQPRPPLQQQQQQRVFTPGQQPPQQAGPYIQQAPGQQPQQFPGQQQFTPGQQPPQQQFMPGQQQPPPSQFGQAPPQQQFASGQQPQRAFTPGQQQFSPGQQPPQFTQQPPQQFAPGRQPPPSFGQQPPQQQFMPGQQPPPPQFGQQPPPPPSFGQQPPPPPQFTQPPQMLPPGHHPTPPPMMPMDPSQQQQQQQKPRIDPDQIPSPIHVQDLDQQAWNTKTMETASRQMPPLASSQYLCVDNGNCSPRFVRATTYCFPTNADHAAKLAIPLGLIVQPMAELLSNESPPPVVQAVPLEGGMGMGGGGVSGKPGTPSGTTNNTTTTHSNNNTFGPALQAPVRCTNCQAYINCHVRWLQGGQKYQCNICDTINPVPAHYFANLDMTGRRVDLHQRPELQQGTVDFRAGREFCVREPRAASWVFLVDVSWQAVQSGVLATTVQTLKEMVEFFPCGEEQEGTPCRVGIVTFDRVVHFYNIKAGLAQPQMMVVADVDDLFVPLSDGFLVNPIEAKSTLLQLLDTLPTLFANTTCPESCMPSAVQACTTALHATGGRLIVMQSVLVNVGPGTVRNREDPKVLGTEKERVLFAPQTEFYRGLGERCVDAGVGVDLFLFPCSYIDVASIGTLAALTGGQTYFYPNFMAARDGYQFAEDLRRVITRPFAFDAVLRVRCSNGLRVTDHFGNFHMKNATDVSFGVLDSEKALAIQVKHDGKLDEKQEVYFQVALLYTSMFGERRIRVFNLALISSNMLGNVFRYAEMDAIVNYISKAAITQTLEVPLKTVRDTLTEKCVQILAAYRRFCATSSAPGQLILPESCKLYPVYTLSVLKSKAFRSGADVTSDFRVHEMRLIRSLGVQASINFFYPRLIPVHDLEPGACQYDPTLNRFLLPRMVRTSVDKLVPEGVYLLDGTVVLFMWIGRNASAEVLQDLFGVNRCEDVDVSLREMPNLDNTRSKQVRTLLHHIQQEERKGPYPVLKIVRPGDPMESIFMNRLVEDKNNDGMTYVDYLCFVHRQIQLALAD